MPRQGQEIYKVRLKHLAFPEGKVVIKHYLDSRDNLMRLLLDKNEILMLMF